MSTKPPHHVGYKTFVSKCAREWNPCSPEGALHTTVGRQLRACRPRKFGAAWITHWKTGHSISLQHWQRTPRREEAKGNDRMVCKKRSLYRSKVEALQCF